MHLARDMTRSVAMLLALLVSTNAFAQGYRPRLCQELWVERNQIYQEAGYCFKTQRAIRYFGNAGCRYDRQDDVPLSQNQRRRVQQIISDERLNACQE